MMRLPDPVAKISKNQSELVEMRGINWSDNFQPGDLADSLNISARRWPYIATRHGRAKQTPYQGGTALTGWDKLVAVQGTDLLYDGNVVGHVSAGEKQFAVVNTKLVIWPDKVYLDLTSLEVHPLGTSCNVSGKAVFQSTTVTVAGVDFSSIFTAGDGIEISGCTTFPANNGTFVIQSVNGDTLTFGSNTFTAGTEAGKPKLERSIPDMDYICESENRLWGCSNKKQTIYASALGNPMNFNVFEGLSTDSYALAVGTPGEFTGCCKLSSMLLFWKQNTLHKILGSFPAEYSMTPYTIEGLREGCHKSLQVINETLFYMGLHGIYAYSGGSPSLVSQGFGEKELTEAVGGNDGDSYYLSCKDKDGTWHLFIYETRAGIWVHEDNLECIDFARIGKNLYFLDSAGDVYLCDNGEDDQDIQWMVQYKPFYETATGRKRFSKLSLRLELPAGSWVILRDRRDGGAWRQVGQVVGRKSDVIPLRIPITRCDKYEFRLEGKGSCTILSVAREFSVGSEK